MTSRRIAITSNPRPPMAIGVLLGSAAAWPRSMDMAGTLAALSTPTPIPAWTAAQIAETVPRAPVRRLRRVRAPFASGRTQRRSSARFLQRFALGRTGWVEIGPDRPERRRFVLWGANGRPTASPDRGARPRPAVQPRHVAIPQRKGPRLPLRRTEWHFGASVVEASGTPRNSSVMFERVPEVASSRHCTLRGG